MSMAGNIVPHREGLRGRLKIGLRRFRGGDCGGPIGKRLRLRSFVHGMSGGLLGIPFLRAEFGSLTRSLLLCLTLCFFGGSLHGVTRGLRLKSCPLSGKVLGCLFGCQARRPQLRFLSGMLLGFLFGFFLRCFASGLFCRLTSGELFGFILCPLSGLASGDLFGLAFGTFSGFALRTFFCLASRLLRGLPRGQFFRIPPRLFGGLLNCRSLFGGFASSSFGGQTRSHLFGLAQSPLSRFSFRLFSSLTGNLLGSLVRGKFFSLQPCTFRGFLLCSLGSLARSPLLGELRKMGFFLSTSDIGHTPHFRGAFLIVDILHLGWMLRIRKLLRFTLLIFNCLQNTQASLFARLGARRREVAILGSVKICPGIECRHIFRRLILVEQRPMISHFTPQ
jgi:hypothetical protein